MNLRAFTCEGTASFLRPPGPIVSCMQLEFLLTHRQVQVTKDSNTLISNVNATNRIARDPPLIWRDIGNSSTCRLAWHRKAHMAKTAAITLPPGVLVAPLINYNLFLLPPPTRRDPSERTSTVAYHTTATPTRRPLYPPNCTALSQDVPKYVVYKYPSI